MKIFFKKTFVTKNKIIAFNLIQLFWIALISMGADSCQPVEIIDYKPVSVEELDFLSSSWCGYDMQSYSGTPLGTKIKTLFKINLKLSGKLNISTVTQNDNYYIPQNFDLICRFPTEGTLNCEGNQMIYEIYDQYIQTDMLKILFNGLQTIRFYRCTKDQMDQF